LVEHLNLQGFYRHQNSNYYVNRLTTALDAYCAYNSVTKMLPAPPPHSATASEDTRLYHFPDPTIIDHAHQIRLTGFYFPGREESAALMAEQTTPPVVDQPLVRPEDTMDNAASGDSTNN
jgi:hypothetical protein